MHDGSFLARFLDEARVQAQLNHPGVAQVLEAATDEQGEPFTVVEYIEGRSLADVRQRSLQMGVRVGWFEAVAIAIEMCQALAHVHERVGVDGTPLGIVHRDLSPQNVMIGYGGDVKLIDFGTARGQNRRCHTVAGVVFAKPGYVAPEVARQEVGDGRIDVYALGVMLWEMCKGGRLLMGDPQRHLEDAASGLTIIPPVARGVGAPPGPRRGDREADGERSRQAVPERGARGRGPRQPPRGSAAVEDGRARHPREGRHADAHTLAAGADEVAPRVRAAPEGGKGDDGARAENAGEREDRRDRDAPPFRRATGRERRLGDAVPASYGRSARARAVSCTRRSTSSSAARSR